MEAAPGTPHKLLRVVRALHQRGYPCFARTYIYALGTWRFELYLEQGDQEPEKLSLFRYSSAGGDRAVVEDASPWTADELATILIHKHPELIRRPFTAREVQFRRWWGVVCLAIGTQGLYYEFSEGEESKIINGHPKFKFGAPPSWYRACSDADANNALLVYVAEVEDDIKDTLVSLAKAATFAKMFKLLKYFPEFASCGRPGGQSGYTLLHHAAFVNAPADVIKNLVLLGANLSAVTSKGETPAKVGLSRGMSAEKARMITPT